MVLIFLYLTTCLLVAYLARGRGLNFLAFFLLSIVITPLLTLIILLVTQGTSGRGSGPRSSQITCLRCHHALSHLKDVEYCSHCGEAL